MPTGFRTPAVERMPGARRSGGHRGGADLVECAAGLEPLELLTRQGVSRLDAVDGATRDELIKLCYAAGESLKAGQDDSKKVASLAPAETKPSTE